MMKYYFDKNGEYCYTAEYFRELMAKQGITQMDVYQAVPEYNTEYFYCKYFGETGLKGEDCGDQCEAYSPRNGRSGRCRYSGICYTPGEKITLIKP